MRKSAYLLFLLALAGARVAAQPAPAENPPATPPANTDEVSIKETEAPKLIVTKGAKDTLSVDFPNEDIRTILRNVADLFELNIVIPDTLQGKASIKLRDVTWRQIFQVVLTPAGYTFIEDANIIKVVSLESLQQEPTTTEVFILNYARAADIQPSFAPLIDAAAGGKIQIDARVNALIITERPSHMNRIRPIIAQLDKATAQVMIESKFIEVDDTNTKNIGINWSSLNGFAVGTTGPITNAFGTGATVSGPVTPTTLGSTLKTLVNTQGFANATFTASQFQLVLSALQSDNNSRLVSNPTIVTLNNTDAFINVGEEFPIPDYQYNQQTGTFEVSGFTYKDIGIILKVTPQVNSAGFIKLSLQPEVSSTTQSVSFGGAGGASIPIINTRKAITQVTLKDGSTLGIGGLLSSTAVKNHTNLPLLGQLPVVGRLFRSDDNNVIKTNLLIFITAKTISQEGASTGDVFDPRTTRDIGLLKEDLPGYRDGSDPFAPPPAPEDDKK
ncbi:MAG TPA: secretin N-terminal domain-containing protein [Opitutaceae bacterium]|jgi:type IV pilus assembly protein PilQ|nr:secretin N-terminal domain-containing protein [Opitutaceae bacterium]